MCGNISKKGSYHSHHVNPPKNSSHEFAQQCSAEAGDVNEGSLRGRQRSEIRMLGNSYDWKHILELSRACSAQVQGHYSKAPQIQFKQLYYARKWEMQVFWTVNLSFVFTAMAVIVITLENYLSSAIQENLKLPVPPSPGASHCPEHRSVQWLWPQTSWRSGTPWGPPPSVSSSSQECPNLQNEGKEMPGRDDGLVREGELKESNYTGRGEKNKWGVRWGVEEREELIDIHIVFHMHIPSEEYLRKLREHVLGGFMVY